MNAAVTNVVDCATELPEKYPAALHTRAHAFRTDLGTGGGGTDAAPSPHDYFDAALAACKVLTAMWYAKRHAIPLERVESHVERDDSEERAGKYHLRVALTFHGPLSDPQREMLARVVAACPIHKLMTRTEIEIETVA